MNKKASNNSGSRKAPSQKASYISINLGAEMAALEQLGFRERWAYLCCKKKSNFKTGAVGRFGNQKLVYGDIASMVIAPATQGRGQGAIDDTQAKDFLERMEAVGLVANIGRRTNGGLVFELPLSPIKSPAAAGKMTNISPTEGLTQSPENLSPPWEDDDCAQSLSVMINKESNINIERADSAVAESAPVRATGADPAREIPRAATAVAAPRLTAEQIHEVLGDNFHFLDTGTTDALMLYDLWADVGVTLDDLRNAMTSVEEDQECTSPTPADITTRLFPSML